MRIISKDIEDNIEWIESELRNLKTVQGYINNVQSYSAKILNTSAKVKITYADGDNDIITKHYLLGTTRLNSVLTVPENNIQYILTYESVIMDVEGFLIVSTRPIISVENVA